ncbi:hypothetical protein Trydic_g12544 [Trypoxylus dichotomus]
MLETFLRIKLDDVDRENVWLQQSGITTHTARCSIGVVREMFPGRIPKGKGVGLRRLRNSRKDPTGNRPYSVSPNGESNGKLAGTSPAMY